MMKSKNAAAFCRDVRSDAVLKAQVERVGHGDDRLARLVEIGRRAGYHFTSRELATAMGGTPVGASPLGLISVSRELSEQQLAAVSGAGWTMEEHWGVDINKPSINDPLPGTEDPIEP